MSHEVESMAYTNEVPWHGLGTHIAEAPDVDTMIRIAGLNWTVEKRKMMAAGGTNNRYCLEVPRNFALVRSSDEKVLSVVGTHYKPVQNREAFSFFKQFVEAGDATMETAGSLKGGRLVWGLADLDMQFNANGKDPVKSYLLVCAPHEAGRSLIMRVTTVRVVCNNTLTLALGESKAPEFRMSHRCEFNDDMKAKAAEALGLARKQVTAFRNNVKTLKSIPMTTDEVIAFAAGLFDHVSAKSVDEVVEEVLAGKGPRRIQTIMDVYENAPGAEPGNAWGALNAVTYYADHIASGDEDARLSSAWLGVMANVKNKALENLLVKAA